MTDHEAQTFWETRYAGDGHIWSGEPNQALVDVLSDFSPGRALDLGCGEGGDSIWLAQHGWRVTAVDIAATAIARAQDLANASRYLRSTDRLAGRRSRRMAADRDL